MLHNGWGFTEERGQEQYGMTPNGCHTWQSSMKEGDLIPGVESGALVWNSTFHEIEYIYRMDEDTPRKDDIQMFRLAIDAMDAQFGEDNKVWDALIQMYRRDFEDMTSADILGLTREAGISGLKCEWEIKVDSKPCTVSVRLQHGDYGDLYMKLKIAYS